MTVNELAHHLIIHSDEEPTCISYKKAEQIISMLDKTEPLPADLSPKSLADAWNELILFDLPDEKLERWKK